MTAKRIFRTFEIETDVHVLSH